MLIKVSPWCFMGHTLIDFFPLEGLFAIGVHTIVRNVRLKTPCRRGHGDSVPMGVGIPLCGTCGVLGEELEAFTAGVVAHQLSGTRQYTVSKDVDFTTLSYTHISRVSCQKGLTATDRALLAGNHRYVIQKYQHPCILWHHNIHPTRVTSCYHCVATQSP